MSDVMENLSAEEEAALLVRQAAEPARIGEGVSAQIMRAARNLDLPYGRAKRLWYREVRCLSANDFKALKKRVGRLNAEREGRELYARENQARALRLLGVAARAGDPWGELDGPSHGLGRHVAAG